MPNYQNGKIYKLVNDETDEIYIGSTIQPLYKRKNEHVSRYKKNVIECRSSIIAKYPSCKIILIEEFPCNSKMELEKRERYYIETMNCVNKLIPGRTKKEYDTVNKDKIKKYCEENKDHRNEYARNYRKNNKQKVKDYFDSRKEELIEQRKQRYIYQSTWGGNKIHYNNLLLIDVNLFN